MRHGSTRPGTAIANARSPNRRPYVCLLCLCFAASSPSPGPAPSPGSLSVTPAKAAPSAPRHFFGFTPDFGTVSDNTLSANYKRLRRAGARWVRFGVHWWYIERTKGTYRWRSTDRFFAAAACNGLVALPMFIGSPGWASGRSSTIAPPLQTHLPEFQAMIRRVIARYGAGGSYWRKRHRCLGGKGRVPKRPSRIWQVWNEPNVMGYDGGQKSTAEGYGRLLTAADKAINGSIQPARQDGARRADRQPLNRLPEGPLQGGAPSQLTRQRVRPARLRHHSSELPRALEEASRAPPTPTALHASGSGSVRSRWSSCLQKGHSYPARCRNNPLARDEAGQRRYLTRMYRLFLRNAGGLRLRRVAWYSWRDPSLSRATCDFCYGSGLLHRGGRHKPAWKAYVNLARGRR